MYDQIGLDQDAIPADNIMLAPGSSFSRDEYLRTLDDIFFNCSMETQPGDGRYMELKHHNYEIKEKIFKEFEAVVTERPYGAHSGDGLQINLSVLKHLRNIVTSPFTGFLRELSDFLQEMVRDLYTTCVFTMYRW